MVLEDGIIFSTSAARTLAYSHENFFIVEGFVTLQYSKRKVTRTLSWIAFEEEASKAVCLPVIQLLTNP